jgi:glycosyltransferase involved in cell wall biosynthesis
MCLERIELSVIIPTRNERQNVGPLLGQLRQVLSPYHWEVVFVDDSSDGTEREIERQAQADPRVRVLHRAKRTNGLSGAVLAGVRESAGTFLCVMDGDLQHPPSTIPRLLAEAKRTSADMVIASRYLPDGDSAGLDGIPRSLVSRALASTSRALFPRRLAGITDPLAGYFLCRRAIVDAANLRPTGYKILLEILIRAPWQLTREIPYRFAARHGGTSKAGAEEAFRFLCHLSRLLLPASAPLLRPRGQRPRIQRPVSQRTGR